jgi:hypothetical protein
MDRIKVKNCSKVVPLCRVTMENLKRCRNQANIRYRGLGIRHPTMSAIHHILFQDIELHHTAYFVSTCCMTLELPSVSKNTSRKHGRVYTHRLAEKTSRIDQAVFSHLPPSQVRTKKQSVSRRGKVVSKSIVPGSEPNPLGTWFSK